MNRFVILAQSETTARALGAWLELLGEPGLELDGAGCLKDDRVRWSADPESARGGFVPLFHRLAADLEPLVNERSDASIVVLVDSIDRNNLSAVRSPDGWNRLIALLILSFPEIRWVFGVSTGDGGGGAPGEPEWEARHGLASLLAPGHDPLFDGMGLRGEVRRQTQFTKTRDKTTGKESFVAPWIPLRSKWAVAIDDETAYAYLHAYVAYRHGYRAFAVTTKALGDALLGKEGESPAWGLGKPALTLEDFFLGFPDKGNDDHWSTLEQREVGWPKLTLDSPNSGETPIPRRYFITSCHNHGLGEEDQSKNRETLSTLRSANRSGIEVTKPLSGIFALWQALRLDRELKSFDRHSGHHYRGFAPGFFWPPPADSSIAAGASDTGHSAPGLLLLVADSLIARAERLVGEVRNVRDAVRGAVLATTAAELLGPRTPTTAREALELKHRFEVLAECQFGGIEYDLPLKERFAEIRAEMRLIGKWFGRRSRDTAILNGEFSILSSLVTIYRDHNEFDEEDKCLQRVRQVHRGIWRRRNAPLSWVIWPLKAYVEYLLGSTMRYAIALALWLGGLSVVFHFSAIPQTDLAGAAHSAFLTFFGADPPGPEKVGALGFICGLIGSFSGFLHLGIFISRLYNLISRK